MNSKFPSILILLLSFIGSQASMASTSGRCNSELLLPFETAKEYRAAENQIELIPFSEITAVESYYGKPGDEAWNYRNFRGRYKGHSVFLKVDKLYRPTSEGNWWVVLNKLKLGARFYGYTYNPETPHERLLVLDFLMGENSKFIQRQLTPGEKVNIALQKRVLENAKIETHDIQFMLDGTDGATLIDPGAFVTYDPPPRH